MQIALCVNASAAIGGGHIMRCLTLANEITLRGGAAAFFVNSEATATAPALGRCGLPVVIASNAMEDRRAAVRGIFPHGVDWALFDIYQFEALHEKSLRDVAAKIAVIDDLANRPHDCELLIDATLERKPADYLGLVPAGCEFLLGAGYALLRPEFAALRDAALARRAALSSAGRILVSFGLTDVAGITGRVVRALVDSGVDADIDVVIAPTAQSRAALEFMAGRSAHIALHIDPPDMAKLMSRADIAVGAAGATSWERCCLGLPTILVVLADNQRLIAKRLAAAGAAIVADHSDAAAIAAKVRDLLLSPAQRLKMAHAAQAVCDGAGAGRIVDRMERAS